MKRNRGWLCFVLCYLGYMGVYISRNNLSIISPQLKEAGFATEAQLGLLTGLFSLGYAAGKLICGPLGDRFNPKNVAALGVAISGVSNILIGISVWFFSLLSVYAYNVDCKQLRSIACMGTRC